MDIIVKDGGKELLVTRNGGVQVQVCLHEIEGVITVWASKLEGATVLQDEYRNPVIQIPGRRGMQKKLLEKLLGKGGEDAEL